MLLLTSCAKISSGVDLFSDDEIRFGNAGILVDTKAFAKATNTTLQTNGFNVAAVIDDGNTTMFNKAVAYSNGAYAVPSEKYYWPVTGTMSFYGVYPKTQAITLNSGAATLSYSHDTDTDLIAAKAVAVAKLSPIVTLAFKHLLSQVNVMAQGTETTVDYKVFSVKITDANGGTYTYADGEWTPSTTTQTYAVYDNASGMTVSTSSMTAVGSAMSFMPGSAKLQVVWKCYNKGTSAVVCERDVTVDVTLPQGKNTTLNLTLPFDSTDLTFVTSVGAWLTDSQNVNMGYTPELVNGVFTVNNSGKKVKFTKGNLYWNGGEFRCEEKQYDYPTTRVADHIGYFFYSKTASVAYAASYSDPGKTITDIFFAADGGAIEGFTVLDMSEWVYLFKNALAKNSSSKNTITIDGKNCIVLKPDGFSGTVADSYTADEWAEAEKAGLVAQPFSGFYDSTSNSSNDYANLSGGFWSTTPDKDDAFYAWYLFFSPTCAENEYARRRSYAYPVRLVSVQ